MNSNLLVALSAISLTALIPIGSASAQSMLALTGKCTQLVVGKNNFTNGCDGKILSTTYNDGRVGFYFVLKNGAILTISGMDLPNPSKNSDAFRIDRLIFNIGGGVPSSSTRASGKCVYTNPYIGKATVTCTGKTASGEKIAAKFVTDGRPPRG